MNLYIVFDNYPLGNHFGAYWAESPNDAIRAAKDDGATGTRFHADMVGFLDTHYFHVPDFQGRKVYEFERCKRTYLKESHRDEVLDFIYVASDDGPSAQAFIDLHYPRVKTELVHEATYCVRVISGKNADEMFEEGWDK